ncbi:cytochrome c oxidase assembly protein [Alteromonas aestuariivivens]|uniref:Cytochrome c oxidase assembly protein CtaG n=1 Tax=Alteromonas aestuariivivens TaxID=1938339 RepID=A0A3D8M5F4_9ALTE|nr:cytochrome c oxidase assembly protein [Alteromonas aestuariivivens]RDV24838.1 cytochrome c oxidase assembly protein [Alteromonas aestuariivivens]
MTATHRQNRALVIRLLLVVVAMFGFGFALVPLYDVFCDITGINGKTDSRAAVYDSIPIDQSREVTVEFIARTNAGMPWEFQAQTTRVKVHPGELNTVSFFVRNPSGRSIVAQAIPSVSPGQAALYLNKTECFCFNQQPLAAGEEAHLPMQFYVDPQLPQDITYFTVQYTLYDVTARADELATQKNPFLTEAPASGS